MSETNERHQDQTRQAAIEYAEINLPVLPHKKKIPMLPNWVDAATIDPEQANEWWTNQHQHHGVGIATGERSGLWVLDIDNKPEANGYHTLSELENRYGALPKTVTCDTGGGGKHFYFAWDPDRPIQNGMSTKLGPGIDIRGSGGYVAAPPSTHPTGPQYKWSDGASIHETTIADAPEWLYTLLLAEDTRVARPATTSARGDGPANWVDNNHTWHDLLIADGWVEAQEVDGSQAWIRPGKADLSEHSHSALEHSSGVLNVFSTDSTLNALWQAGKDNATCVSLTKFSYLTATRFNGDKSACARHYLPQCEAERDANVEALMRDLGPLSTHSPGPRSHPAITGKTLNEIAIPSEFWEARPELEHIKQAAESRGRAADAILGAVLARVAAFTPHTIGLPAIVGSWGSLNCIHAMVGGSGRGKTDSMSIAAELMSGVAVPHRTKVDIPVGSGEGLIAAYYGERTQQIDGRNVKVQQQTTYHSLFVVDEIAQLVAQAGRQGSTLLATLCTMVSGGLAGQSNAKKETSRLLREHTYRLAMIVGVQPDKASYILDDEAGGVPQRFVWFALEGPERIRPNLRREWPGPLEWQPIAPWRVEGVSKINQRSPIGVPDNIADEILEHDWLHGIGQSNQDIGASHRNLMKLKLAALLAILNGRRGLNDEDWSLADILARTSDALYLGIRERLAELDRVKAEQADKASTNRSIQTHQALDDRKRRGDGFDSAIQSFQKLARKNEGHITRKQAGDCRSRKGKAVTLGESLDEAVRRGVFSETKTGFQLTT